jgi:hypothetical protein
MATDQNSYTSAEYQALVKSAKKQKDKERIKRIHSQFTDWLTANNIAFFKEYHFNKSKEFGAKDWRNDYYLPELNLAIEVEGGIFSGGGHVRGAMYRDNLDKYNAITMAKIQLLRIDTDRLNSAYFKGLILILKNF